MSFGTKLASFAGALILAGSVFASPSICPSIDDIKANGISMAEQIAPSLFLSYHVSNYNTDSTWGFFIAPILAESNDEAIGIANDVLGTMNAPGLPDEHEGLTVCSYETGRSDFFAAAIKDNSTISPLKLKQYFKRAH